MNTVILAHDQEGRDASENMKGKAAGPLLTGKLVKQFPAQCDMFLRFEQLYQSGNVKEFIAYTDHQNGMPARCQGIKLPPTIENPSYAVLRAALDEL